MRRWLQDGHVDDSDPGVGFELEGWLVDRDCMPAPDNERFLARAEAGIYAEMACEFAKRSNPVSVGAGTGALSVVATQQFAIRGRVTTTSGAPLEDVKFDALSTGSGSDGRYAFLDWPNGK